MSFKQIGVLFAMFDAMHHLDKNNSTIWKPANYFFISGANQLPEDKPEDAEQLCQKPPDLTFAS